MDDDIVEESGRLGDKYRELAEQKGCLLLTQANGG